MSAGTKYTPSLPSSAAASASVSAAPAMMPSPSRSHCTAAPVSKIDASSAYVLESPMHHASVVTSPAGGVGTVKPAFSSTNEPVP